MGKTIKNSGFLQVCVFVLLLFPLMWADTVSATGQEESPPPGEEVLMPAGDVPATGEEGSPVEYVPATGEEESQAGEKRNYSIHLGGYVRTWASFNLKDQPETEGYSDRYKASMLRGALLLDCDAKAGPFTFKVIGRGDQEVKTDYLSRLEDDIKAGKYSLGQVNGPGSKIMDEYNQTELREYYVEFEPIKRVKFRLGRQQVVWGETDFFRAMDVVHGFDYRWRSFLEPENEELRKPLILANAMIQVPELRGSLQLLFRPGTLNSPEWTGNTMGVAGGRWNTQPYKGIDFLTLVSYDYHHPDGDSDDNTWGLRWSGIAGPVSYTLGYLRTFNNNPVANSGVPGQEYGGRQAAGLACDLIYPKIDLVGVTASGYIPWIDAVLSTEISYTLDEAFNYGSQFNVGPGLIGRIVVQALSGGDPTPLYNAIYNLLVPQGFPYTADQVKSLMPTLQSFYNAYIASGKTKEDVQAMLTKALSGELSGGPPLIKAYLEGLQGIIKKDGLMTMLRVDKNFAFTQWMFGTRKPSFCSVQVFNHMIMDYDRNDDIVNFGYGQQRKENETMITAVMNLNYMNDKINATLAGGWDASYGDFFAVPNVEISLGDHWRLRLEADFFFPSGQNDGTSGGSLDLTSLGLGLGNYTLGHAGGYENVTSMVGALANSDQFLMRLTYQF